MVIFIIIIVAFLYRPLMAYYLLFQDCYVGGQKKMLELLNKGILKEEPRVYCIMYMITKHKYTAQIGLSKLAGHVLVKEST